MSSPGNWARNSDDSWDVTAAHLESMWKNVYCAAALGSRVTFFLAS